MKAHQRVAWLEFMVDLPSSLVDINIIESAWAWMDSLLRQ